MLVLIKFKAEQGSSTAQGAVELDAIVGQFTDALPAQLVEAADASKAITDLSNPKKWDDLPHDLPDEAGAVQFRTLRCSLLCCKQLQHNPQQHFVCKLL